MSKISDTTLAAMADELEKIAFFRNVGVRIGTWLGKKGDYLKAFPGNTWEAGKAMVTDPAGSLKHGWQATWDPKMGMYGGKLSGTLMVGGTGLQVAGAAKKDDPTGRGESRVTRGARVAGGTLAGLAGMRKGIGPSIALGIAGDSAAGAVAKRFDKRRGYVPPPPKPTEA